MWSVEITDEFEGWWNTLAPEVQDAIDVVVLLLMRRGPSLGFPHSSQIKNSKFGRLRELRIQCSGRPYRVLYAFDPRRTAILLIGGAKTGNDRWYDVYVPIAERLYEEHVEQLRSEGLL
jgi:hypothetical protein